MFIWLLMQNKSIIIIIIIIIIVIIIVIIINKNVAFPVTQSQLTQIKSCLSLQQDKEFEQYW